MILECVSGDKVSGDVFGDPEEVCGQTVIMSWTMASELAMTNTVVDVRVKIG